MSPNDQYRLWTFVFLFRLTKQSVNDHLREFNICISKKTPTSWAQHDTLQETIAFANKRKSFLVIQLKNKLSDLKPLFSHKKSLTFQKRSKKMFLHWTANLADRNKHQPLKIDIRVTYHTVLSVWNTPLIDTCQHCSTSRANQAPNAGFQNRGVCLQAFPSFPSPSPHFHFSRGQNRESRSSVFLCSETKRKRLLRRLSDH